MTDLRVRVHGVLAKRRKDEAPYQRSNSQYPMLKRRGLSHRERVLPVRQRQRHGLSLAMRLEHGHDHFRGDPVRRRYWPTVARSS